MNFSSRGFSVPALGLGTYRLSGAEGRAAIEEALRIGYRHLDTAQMYGNEADVGAAIARSGVPRDTLWVTTKLAPDQLAPDVVPASVESSLGRLGLDHVDLLLIHWPDPTSPVEPTLEAMADCQEAGLASALGVSNFPPSLWERATRVAPLVTNQVEAHVYFRQRGLVAAAASVGAFVTAYSPLARGRVASDPTLVAIASRIGATPSQVALRALLDAGCAAIPKSAAPARLEENLGALDLTLTEADRAEIAKLDAGRRLIQAFHADHDWEA